MDRPVSDIAFTPAVKSIQERLGSRATYERMEQGRGWDDRVTPRHAAFIAARDSFYIATASADGQPYLQHRGGPKGFLKIIDEHTLAFADFTGNNQYISMGNLAENDRVCLFLMDYAGRARLKIWGTAKVVEDDADLIATVADPAYAAEPRRVFVIHVSALDVNCPQHITPRFTSDQVDAVVGELRAKVEALQFDKRNCCPEE